MENPRVTVQTNKGSFVIELEADKTPKTVESFLSYVADRHYDGTIFHRVIDGFMVQGGGYAPSLEKKPTKPPVENEADRGLKNTRGTVAMARTSDPHSATAQFFVNVSDNAFLNHRDKSQQGWGYTAFGRVVEGMEVVDTIKGVKTGARGPFSKDAPLEDVVIESVRREAVS